MKKILLICVSLMCIGTGAFASDNVLQAIQINGVNDSYNIILKSDDVAEVRKTVQSPNKMILLLQGIRASKTINTIYNNTATVDSVVVEPVNNETVKIYIQAANVQNAQVHFDSLKTPLGVLNNESQTNASSNTTSNTKSEILLNGPMNSFRPVYDRENDENEGLFDGDANTLLLFAKRALGSDKASWLFTLGLLITLISGGVSLLRKKEHDIKIGLSNTNMQQREIDMYRNLNADMQNTMSQVGLRPAQPQSSQPNVNYGLKAYQNTSRNPYTTPEIQRPRSMANMGMHTGMGTSNNNIPNSYSLRNSQSSASNQPNALQKAAQEIIKRNSVASKNIPSTINKTMSKPISSQRPKTSNIDSMKFLESMTRIYEKNGRSDLAQGLKNNIQKAKVNVG